jgi:hypothetical protein
VTKVQSIVAWSSTFWYFEVFCWYSEVFCSFQRTNVPGLLGVRRSGERLCHVAARTAERGSLRRTGTVCHRGESARFMDHMNEMAKLGATNFETRVLPINDFV